MAEFVVADWHLGEDRFEIMGRPFHTQLDMVSQLRINHNAVVGKDDTVYMLGDVCYQKAPEFLKYVECFNGRKILVRGNHDKNITDEEFLKYFEKVIPEGDGIDLDIHGIPCYLTHYPTCGKPERFNLVGHIHAAWKYQLNMLNVGVDVHHFRPVDLEKIPFHVKAVCEFYDEDVWVGYHNVNANWRSTRGKKSTYFNK